MKLPFLLCSSLIRLPSDICSTTATPTHLKSLADKCEAMPVSNTGKNETVKKMSLTLVVPLYVTPEA